MRFMLKNNLPRSKKLSKDMGMVSDQPPVQPAQALFIFQQRTHRAALCFVIRQPYCLTFTTLVCFRVH